MNNSDKTDIKSKLRMMMGIHGIANIMECMTEIAQEFGEGAVANGRFALPDSWWRKASAYLNSAYCDLRRISRYD